jgi:uncharacterized protein with ATP-grasp and redox domains
MELALECGACAAIQLSRTLSVRTKDWKPAYEKALHAIAAAYAGPAEPARVLSALYASVAESLQDGDFYQTAKDVANAQVERWWTENAPALTDLSSRLLLAAAGNAIDAGVDVAPDVVFAHFEAARQEEPGRDDRSQFLSWLYGIARPRVLYLLDNAGEAVFDREVMRTLRARGASVTAVVRHAPILNDVTPREAALLGLEEVARVTDTGSPGYGLVSWVESGEYVRLTDAADLVVSKGIANLETLSHRPLPRPALFLYRAKCGPSARAADAAPGTTVIWWKPV